MFEQELYNYETPAPESQEGELFHNYEIKNWDISKRVYQILAISAVFNISLLAFIGQSQLLTMKGCDSPFVGRVCQVLDSVYVTSVLFGSERDYVDAAYDKIDLGDAEITFIDVSAETPPFNYPVDYFRIANPVQYAMQQQMAANSANGYTDNIPAYTPNSGVADELMNTKPVTPKANPNALQGDDPKSPFSVAGNSRKGKGSRPRNGRMGNGNGVDDGTAAQADPTPEPTPGATPEGDKVDPITGDVYNSRPFKDLRVLVKKDIEKNGLNLQTGFVFNAKAKLTKEGKLDPKSFKYGEVKGDEKLIKILKEAIGAFSDSGRLLVLKELTGKDLNLSISQDDLFISAVVQSEVGSDTRAQAIKSSLDLMISIAKKMKADPNASENDKDDLALLEGAKIEQSGKNITIKFTIPKDVAHKMIQRKLDEEPKPEVKPNSTARVAPDNSTSGK